MALLCMLTEKQKEVLTLLAEFLGEHDINIGGCGCCGSPWLLVEDKALFDSEDINKENLLKYLNEEENNNFEI